MAPSEKLVKELVGRSSGKTHWQKEGTDEQPLCGTSFWSALSGVISDPEFEFCVTCKTCNRMLKRRRENDQEDSRG
ncbi:hypothetical protein PBI_LAMBO_69 [Gordonia phage Lambo]|uniref:Uncharacterized protein n=4 Tax=Lambovirus TaxID=2843412 RepID=A0A5J6TLF1_9CAUD|nr:hypothetical protein HWC68_gp73 [Gordonia phage Gibbin]YP_009852622.1 hypothetical protein HWC70_gp69 [Gordonia phage Lambo]UVT31798.1 hypothetical protein SEA_PATOS_75 [Gordonia phage Patos]WNN95361.1 hypothetical protein SEA_NORMANRE_75 [Gordonia phage NorManre]WNO27214.1 hypothetical protein SEA_FULCRUM_71 [Gordonia phage Fulcrum]QFG10639.1 hypothetical protein PBI_GIBBIN_73 [Gordonia phage Gibbin]QFG13607.1 hypothetical protein PBI_LAMBO_69 [Gordonia phage Lambo]